MHALDTEKTFHRFRTPPTAQLHILPHGHGGPNGSEPQPMTSQQPNSPASPVGEEAPLVTHGNLFDIAVHGQGRARREALRQLPPDQRREAQLACQQKRWAER